jgi:flagellum-specific ATP synthase
VLTRSLAHAGHYPAIDILHSVSRLIGEISSPEVEQAGQRLRAALAVLHEKEDLVSIGAYQPGSDPALDAALSHRPQIERFLRQPVHERSDPQQTDARLIELGASLASELERLGGEIPDAEVLTPEADDAAAAGAAWQAGSGEPAIPALGLSI